MTDFSDAGHAGDGGHRLTRSLPARQGNADRNGNRCDGRGLDDLRQISGEVALLPRAHGSALFARGETQAVALTTLASDAERCAALVAAGTAVLRAHHDPAAVAAALTAVYRSVVHNVVHNVASAARARP